MSELKALDFGYATLEKEWLIYIQTPTLAVNQLTKVLREKLPLRQGYYDSCIFVSEEGTQQFRALEGSHAGDEQTIQAVATTELVVSVPANEAELREAIGVIYEHHVHEEPTIRITEAWGTRSNYSEEMNNPNKYWNREDAAEIHGEVLTTDNEQKS